MKIRWAGHEACENKELLKLITEKQCVVAA